MYLYAPPLNKLRRFVRPITSATDVATRTWEISPREEATTRAAIHLPEELDRITGISAHSNPDYEFARLRPRTLRFAPTNLCELRDVIISNGDVFRRSFKRMVRGHGPRRLLTRIDAEVADAGIFCSTWLGFRYFGHWLAEDFADKIQSAEFGESSELEQARTPHQAGYDAMFGMARRTVPPFCRLRKVMLIESDLGSRFRVDGWHRITRRIRERYPAAPHIGCMLMRGSSGEKRLLVNEAEIADSLRKLGFRIVHPETMTLDALLREVSGSRIVVGVEGSQLSHGFHCLSAPGAMVVLQPPNRFGCTDKDRCDRKGLLYAFTIGLPADGGFRIELSSLQNILDKVSAELDRSARLL